MSTLSGLFILALIAALWVNAMRAHEMAVRACVRGCRERGVQLLDQTVAIARIRLCRTSAGLRLERIYRFDFSEQGTERRTGHLTLRGHYLSEFSLGLPSTPENASETSQGLVSPKEGQGPD